MFTVTLLPRHSETFRELRLRLREDFLDNREEVARKGSLEWPGPFAGAGYFVEHPVARPAIRGCSRCEMRSYVVDLPGRASMWVWIRAGSRARTDGTLDDGMRALRSLQRTSRDPSVGLIEAFLDARVVREADRFLSPKARSLYRRAGLYAFGEPGEPNHIDITAWNVEQLRRFANRLEVHVAAVGRSGAQRELVVMDGRRTRGSVECVMVTQKSGTS